jgi:hypothetical protein
LIKQSTQLREKRRNKEREDPSLSQRSKTQSGSLRDKGTNHVPKPHPSQEAHSKKKRMKNLNKQ